MAAGKTYENVAKDRAGLRGLLTDAADGVVSVFGRKPEDDAGDEEKKVLGTWTKELELAENFFSDYQKDAMRCVHAYLDEHNQSLPTRPKYKLNLYHANVTTLMSIMYAKLPKVEADRRFADPSDDVARVAAEIITRLLSNDMNDPEDKLAGAIKQALQDRLTAGLGSCRVRYAMTEKEDPTFVRPEGAPEDLEAPKVKDEEWCDIEYVHWRDILWSPCRVPAELRWKAFRVYMTKAEVTARFGKEIARIVSFASRGPKLDPEGGPQADQSSHEDAAQAEVWEIWDKASHRVYWYVKGCPKFLDVKDDPMKLDGFFPDAPAMVANTATIKYLPKPDYLLSEDLYEEINELEARIAMLTKACKVVGVYPASAEEMKRILTEATENQLIPVENWAMFADKGGLKGQIDYLPIKEIAETLQVLVMQQQARIQQLYQVTGMSDIIRGQASTTGVTATEQRIKAQFASTRMQTFQDEFANFVAELLNRKVSLIRKYYDPDRIKRLSNIENTPDAQFADQAIMLIKDESQFDCRVAVRAETMAQIDYESLKMERSEFLGAVSTFLGSSAPLLEQMPDAAPFLMELLKFNLAGMKGAKQMEGVFDQAISAMQQAQAAKAQQPPEPTPEEKAAKIKVDGQIQVEQAKAAAGAQTEQMKAGLEMQKLQAEMQADREKHQLEMEKMRAQIELLYVKLGIEQQQGQMELQHDAATMEMEREGQQQEQAFEAASAEREFEHDERRMDLEEDHAERSFEREEEQSEARFKQESRHADAAARRESQQPKGGE